MTRAALVLDRAATLVAAIVLIALGSAILIWNTALFDGIPETITAPGLVTASNTAWWPWAVTGGGVLLILLGLRWLASHRPSPRIGRTALPRGSDHDIAGRSSGDIGALASASARALEADPHITTASARAVVDRRRRTVEITATAASPDALAGAAAAADRVARDAVTMIGDNTLATRALIRIDTSRGNERHLE